MNKKPKKAPSKSAKANPSVQSNEEAEKLRKMYEEQMRAQQEAAYKAQEAQRDAHFNAVRARQIAAQHQHELATYPRQQYAAIVAVDENGGFSKDGQIPWHYPSDFKWFQKTTTGQICVMGRVTYDDINKRMGEKGETSVLPNRRCFVVTSMDLPRANATAIKSISEIEKHLSHDDLTKTVFFIGGERIYKEGIALANTVYITVINKDHECDRKFPVNYVQKHFMLDKTFEVNTDPDLRFTIWKRAQ